MTDWKLRHIAATNDPAGVEQPLLALLTSAQVYAEEYERHFGSYVGDDAVLGPAWADMLHSLIGLLNGPTGRLDAGVLDGMARKLARDHRWTEEL